VNVINKFKDFMGLNDDDGYESGYDDIDDAYRGEYPLPEPVMPQPIEEERRIPRKPTVDRSQSASKMNNVVGMPGIMHGVSEMVLIEPRSFEEMPQVIDAIRQRKSVILNMTLIRQEEAQRSVDFVAGGTYAIDGHYERIGDNIFLFTPNCVQVSTPNQVIHEVVERTATTQSTRSSRTAERTATAWGEDTMHAAQ
jgi:cell division inhibitor SepF